MSIKQLPLGANLYVKNLKSDDPHQTFVELNALFSKYGTIYSIRLHLERDGSLKEYAYI
jgi:RNA recognition motif-containing protein